MIHLASNSPRRQELLTQMGVLFEVIPQYAQEVHQAHESPGEYVTRLALEKATDGLARQENQMIPVLGSDTAVILNGRILGKPRDKEDGIAMLLSLSNQTHQVMTAVALKTSLKTEQILSVTDVTFSSLDRQLCENYWLTGEPVDKAGAYGIQGKAALFISNINGSYSGVMGLPIYESKQLLEKFNILTI